MTWHQILNQRILEEIDEKEFEKLMDYVTIRAS